MSISKDKEEVHSIIPKRTKKELLKIAKLQDRTLSNLISVILTEYVKK